MKKTQLYIKLFFSLLLFPSCVNHEKEPDAGPITYEKNIKDILKKRCSHCHNSSWPKTDWSNYDTVLQNLEKIKQRVVVEQTMPPNGMPVIDRIFIKKWIKRGAPK